MPEWLSTAWSYLLVALGFSLVIFVHELGHFLAAKWAKVKVERFAIGFGQELIGFTKGGTRYSLNMLPLGGYVKMLGQEDFVVDKSGELKVKEDPDSFTSKSIGKRMVIVSAGVVMNLIFAAVAFAIVVMVGRLELPAIVGSVMQDTPAARAGLKSGDRITSVNGKPVRTFDQLTSAIMLCDSDEVEFEISRDGKIFLSRLTPEYRKDESVRMVGIHPGMNQRVELPSFQARDDARPDELHMGDELESVIINGQPKKCMDMSEFHQAIVEARGQPVELVVKRPKHVDELKAETLVDSDAKVDSDVVKVKTRAVWLPYAYDSQDAFSGSLLGLVPRLSIWQTYKDKSFEQAGAKMGDVICGIGRDSYPTYAQLTHTIGDAAKREIPLRVRRARMENNGLSARSVEFCSLHREELIAAGLKDSQSGMAKAKTLVAASDLPASDKEKLLARLSAAKNVDDWRRFLENVDEHELMLKPKTQFTLVTKAPPPKVDALVFPSDEDHVVVADVQAKLGDRVSPAKAAGIPVGAVILTAAGQPVRTWSDLCEAFRTHAGKSIPLTYRVTNEIHSATMNIPDCLPAALNLEPEARIVAIDGKTSVRLPGRDVDTALPDWRAVESLLKERVGKTAKIEYVHSNGTTATADYAVKSDNVDPWLLRMGFQENFFCFPLRVRYSESNPFKAAWVGFKEAYDATVNTIASIRQIAFKHTVGVDKLSGPVGILRIGGSAADAGIFTLLRFLALISANLAVINFLPMPIVDGGLFLFLILEKLRGEPVSIKTQVATQVIGIALIITLFVLVTYQDIRNWITGA